MKKSKFLAWKKLFFATIVFCNCVTASIASADDKPERHFTFHYGASIDGLKENAKVEIWIPVPQSNPYQEINVASMTLPSVAKATIDKKYGNKMYYLESTHSGSGRLAIQMAYDVKRKEAAASGKLTDAQRKELDQFLKPNELVPIDGKPIETFNGFLKEGSLQVPDDQLASGRVFYNFVEEHMKYDKSKPGYGTGDSNWACDSRTGNCTDFHSLFISVARANKVAAQFRIGFPIPAKRGTGTIGGYHCWAFFHADDHGWVPVDISEADKDPTKKDYFFGKLNENRVQFTTGRDLILNPPQTGKPLNYFVYPYVEVDGKPWPKDKIKLTLKYEDVASK